MTETFLLDTRLEQDSLPLYDLSLCHVRLMNNARFPWLVLIPRRAGVREITDLPDAEQQRLMAEITLTSRVLQAQTAAYKMNIGALGNIVEQLHIHVIARFPDDAAWPTPVWGTGGDAYSPEAEKMRMQEWAAALADAAEKNQ